jgi:ABC-type transport system substrate-binding protein
MPFFCPVPTDTPIVGGGAVGGEVSSVGGGQTVSSAGPYYIADFFNGEYTILKRNPNYAGSRPHGFDAIALREGIDPGQAAGRVSGRGWDGITNLYDPLFDIGGQLAERWGPSSPAAADDQRYFPTPWPHTGYLALNAHRPAFADPGVRRAAALALDRRALAAVYAQIPTDQLLPPAMPGSELGRPSPPDAPDIAAARALMHGRTFTAVMGIFPDCPVCTQEAQVVQSGLARIGIRVRIEEFDNPWDAASRGAAIDLIDSGAQLDYSDPAKFLSSMLTETMPATWLPPGVQAEVEDVLGLDGPERVARAAALADRLGTEEVPVVAVGVGVIGEFLSPRLGCRVFPPFGYGVDLAALCTSDQGS